MEIADRDHYTCQICGQQGKFRRFWVVGNYIRIGIFYKNKRFEIDHIIPLAKDGSNGLDNLQLTCRRCNRSKCAKIYGV
jgi:5-methylcytosine-specific restriction endonuclease McrA